MRPSLADYVHPDRGGPAELRCLKHFSAKFIPTPPPKVDWGVIQEKLLTSYPSAPQPAWIKRGLLYREELEQVMAEVKPDSTPGVPWHNLGPTKGDVIRTHSSVIIDVAVSRITRLMALGHMLTSGEVSYADPIALVKELYCDPVRVFIKQEPHKISKAKLGAWRPICSVSLVDELIDRLIFGPQNKLEIDNWATCPSCPGIGFTPLQTKQLLDKISSFSADMAEADISGWDWSVKDWQFELEARARCLLAGALHDSLFAQLVQARFWCIRYSLYCLSDGTLLHQVHPGVMKSGLYITSSSNSRMRVVLGWIAGAHSIVAMGDDSLESFHPNAEANYKAMGFTLKFYKRVTDSFEFCSHRYYPDGTYFPTNSDKGLFNLLASPYTRERFHSYLYENHSNPELPRLLEVIKLVAYLPEEDARVYFHSN